MAHKILILKAPLDTKRLFAKKNERPQALEKRREGSRKHSLEKSDEML
jgi:hypothetical protein|tara:strand:+ start:744 stop:887 length:144 start_codon:yes stop_codon:yes gene_type:complete